MATAVSIPLQRSREVLVVQQHELSESIIPILRRENVELEIWLQCARGLLRRGDVEAYTKILQSLIKEVEHIRSPTSQERFIQIQAICSLADLNLQQARLTASAETKRQLYADANRLYFDAEKVDSQEMLPHLGLGELALNRVHALLL